MSPVPPFPLCHMCPLSPPSPLSPLSPVAHPPASGACFSSDLLDSNISKEHFEPDQTLKHRLSTERSAHLTASAPKVSTSTCPLAN